MKHKYTIDWFKYQHKGRTIKEWYIYDGEGGYAGGFSSWMAAKNYIPKMIRTSKS